ncbi:MAG: Na+/H+ antiporter subunit E [Rhodospirillaceae bacterium]|nr:Na+/H+ antiporter subunit E [Rhodospirillaceae bacterium]
MRLVGLYFALFAFWLLMSGHYEPLIVGFGVVSCAATVYIARRKDFVDYATLSWYIKPTLPLYWLWLLGQILKANFDVATRCVLPGNRIDPCVFRAPANQDTGVGVATYANSITLTPGTVSLQTWDHEIRVHALTHDSARDVLGGAMDGRVCRVEGGVRSESEGGP